MRKIPPEGEEFAVTLYKSYAQPSVTDEILAAEETTPQAHSWDSPFAFVGRNIYVLG